MQSKTIAERKVTQPFCIQMGELLKLRELSKRTDRSVSDLVREAIDQLLVKYGKPAMDPGVAATVVGVPHIA